jgi:hypothetical protein
MVRPRRCFRRNQRPFATRSSRPSGPTAIVSDSWVRSPREHHVRVRHGQRWARAPIRRSRPTRTSAWGITAASIRSAPTVGEGPDTSAGSTRRTEDSFGASPVWLDVQRRSESWTKPNGARSSFDSVTHRGHRRTSRDDEWRLASPEQSSPEVPLDAWDVTRRCCPWAV